MMASELAVWRGQKTARLVNFIPQKTVPLQAYFRPNYRAVLRQIVA